MTRNDEFARPDLAALCRAADRLARGTECAIIYEALHEACAPTPSPRRLRAFAIVVAGWARDERRGWRRDWDNDRLPQAEICHTVARFLATVSRALKREARLASAQRRTT